MTLWQIDERVQMLLAAIDLLGHDAEFETALRDELERASEDLSQKIDNWAATIAHFEAIAESRAKESKRLQSLADADLRRAWHMRETLKGFLASRDMKTCRTTRYNLTVAGNGGAVPVVVTVPAEELDLEYQKVRVNVEADMQKIREALESGYTVKGARLGQRGSHLRIK